jgi:hypothetical protein
MPSPMPNSSSSTATGPSDGFEDIVRLGRALTKQLEGYENDLTTTWMANHVARLMVEAERAGTDDQDVAEARCREAVLSLWRHRRTLGTRRPLVSADAMLDAITALRDEKGVWYINDLWRHEGYGPDRAINAALHVDAGARAVIRCLVAMSFGQNAQKDLDWLELALSPTFADMADYQSVEALVADANGILGPGCDERNDAIKQKIRADLRLLVATAEDMLRITNKVGEGDDPD